jgi:hypothetical protein
MAAAGDHDDPEIYRRPSRLRIGPETRIQSLGSRVSRTVGEFVRQEIPATIQSLIDTDPRKALFHFARSKRGDKNIFIVRRLIQTIITDGTLTDENKTRIFIRAIELAIIGNNRYTIESLLNTGIIAITAEVGARFRGHVAKYGSPTVFTLLNERNALGLDLIEAPPMLGNDDIQYFISTIAEHGNIDLIRHLIEHLQLNYPSLIVFAAKASKITLLRFLVERGYNVNQVQNRTTPLIACFRPVDYRNPMKVFNFIRYLLDVGADVHVLEEELLATAVVYGDVRMMELLVGAGLNILLNIADDHEDEDQEVLRESSFYIALLFHNWTMLKYLSDLAVSMTTESGTGETIGRVVRVELEDWEEEDEGVQEVLLEGADEHDF